MGGIPEPKQIISGLITDTHNTLEKLDQYFLEDRKAEWYFAPLNIPLCLFKSHCRILQPLFVRSLLEDNLYLYACIHVTQECLLKNLYQIFTR